MPGKPVAPGYFGKLPRSGDFLLRRLPGEFATVWDRFCVRHLVAVMQKDGVWPEAGLRFILGAGQAGNQAFAGLSVPSHDASGRAFPLTIAAVVDFAAVPVPIAQYFASITGAALDAAEGLIDAGELDLALEGCAAPQLPPGPLAPLLLAFPDHAPIETTLTDPAAALAALLAEKVPGI